MEPSLWLGFLGLSTVAVLTPGPTMLAIVGHSVAAGFRRTLPVVVGNALGICVVIGASGAGVAGALARAPVLLTLLQLGGASYLLGHGIQTWRHRAEPPRDTSVRGATATLSQGFLLVWSNPKALLFFGAVLPQFVRPGAPLGLQLVELATTFIALELGVTTVAAAAAGWLASAGTGNRLARLRGAGGLLLALMALLLAASAVGLQRA
jgi:threonine/homoserine/homoserine lactone efflux protein